MKNCTANIFSMASYQQGLVNQIESNIQDWTKKGLPFGSLERIQKIDKQNVSDLKKHSIQPSTHLERFKKEPGYSQLFYNLASFLTENMNKGETGNPIRRTFTIIHHLIKASNDSKIGDFVIGYHIAKYLEKLIPWGGDTIYPEHRQMLQQIAKEKQIKLRETYYVTPKAAEFLDKCAKKIERLISEKTPEFITIDKKNNAEIGNKMPSLCKYIKNVNEEEAKLYSENNDYKSLVDFFVEDTTLRVQQEVHLYQNLIVKGKLKDNQEIKQKMQNVAYLSVIEGTLELKGKTLENRLIHHIVRRALFELCTETNKKPLVEVNSQNTPKESIKKYPFLKTYSELIKV